MAEHKKAGDPAVNILVSIDEKHRDEVHDVARELESAGMKVAEVFAISGVIAGAAAGDDLSKLRSVRGVASVEEEPTFEAQGPA